MLTNVNLAAPNAASLSATVIRSAHIQTSSPLVRYRYHPRTHIRSHTAIGGYTNLALSVAHTTSLTTAGSILVV